MEESTAALDLKQGVDSAAPESAHRDIRCLPRRPQESKHFQPHLASADRQRNRVLIDAHL